MTVYKQRLALVLEPFFIDASERAKAAGRPAYTHLVGLGLGVWQLCDKQVCASPALVISLFLSYIIFENDSYAQVWP